MAGLQKKPVIANNRLSFLQSHQIFSRRLRTRVSAKFLGGDSGGEQVMRKQALSKDDSEGNVSDLNSGVPPLRVFYKTQISSILVCQLSLANPVQGGKAAPSNAAAVSDETGWKRRWTMVALCFVAFMLCNMDRVNMSIAILPISQSFNWNSATIGLVQSSFFW